MTAPRERRRVTIEVPGWVADLRDPGVQSILALFAFAVAGFVLIAFAWRGAAKQIYVPLQMPWLISGGLIGLALVGASLAAWAIHVGRRDDAIHRREVDDLVRDAITLAESLRK